MKRSRIHVLSPGRPATVLLLVASMLLAGMLRPAAAQAPERPEMITPDAEKAIAKALHFLANTQARDGSWRARGGYGGGYPTAMTSLAGLALLAGGHTPVEGEYSRNVRLAIDHVVSNANLNIDTGLIARLHEERSCMHGHGFAMLFLGEAYGMERDPARQQVLLRVLERAVKLTANSQSARGGWLYTPDSNSDEGSVTVTQIQGLRSIRNAGIHVPRAVIDKACDYIEQSQQPDGGIAYRVGQRGSRPPITAAAVAVMYSAGQYEHPVALKSLEYIENMVKNDRGRLDGGHKFYAMLYTAQAMYLSSDENWRSYFPATRDDLVRSQSGSGSWMGDGVGDVYGTAIGAIVLQLPYANLPIFQR